MCRRLVLVIIIKRLDPPLLSSLEGSVFEIGLARAASHGADVLNLSVCSLVIARCNVLWAAAVKCLGIAQDIAFTNKLEIAASVMKMLKLLVHQVSSERKSYPSATND
jgi:hypothetical protein